MLLFMLYVFFPGFLGKKVMPGRCFLMLFGYPRLEYKNSSEKNKAFVVLWKK